MNRLFFLIICFLIPTVIYSQDIVIFTNGDEIKAKVTEVSENEIRYKTWDNQDGPIWIKSATEIFMIRYENGSKQTFTVVKNQTAFQKQSQSIVKETTTSNYSNPTLKIKTNSTICCGLRLKEGPNLLFCRPKVSGVTKSNGTRYLPSFSGIIEYYPSQTIQTNDTTSIYPGGGMCFEIQYAFRGGKLTKGISTPCEIALDYLCLRPGICIRGRGGSIHMGLDFGKKTKGTSCFVEYEDTKNDITEYMVPYTLGWWFDWGYNLSTHLELSLFFDWIGLGLSSSTGALLQDNYWTGKVYTHNLSFGLALSWISRPIKFKNY